MNVDVQVDGIENVVGVIEKYGSPRKFSQAMIKLRAQANATMYKARSYTPVDTGALRASGRVVNEGDTLYITFGGDGVNYAGVVHEDLYANHPVGQAKYLERAMMEDEQRFVDAVAKEYERLS